MGDSDAAIGVRSPVLTQKRLMPAAVAGRGGCGWSPVSTQQRLHPRFPSFRWIFVAAVGECVLTEIR